MALPVIPLRQEYEKDTVEILKSIYTTLGKSEKYEKVGLDVQDKLQRNLSIIRKDFNKTQKKIVSDFVNKQITKKEFEEMNRLNRENLTKNYNKAREEDRARFFEESKKAIDLQESIGYLTEGQKQRLERDKKLLEIQEREEQRNKEILRLANAGFITKKEEARLKRKNKIDNYLEKFLVKRKWLQTAGKFLKGMAERAGSWIGQLLKFLFVMALFPGLLDTIVNIFISVATMIITMLAKHLPRIIGNLIRIITTVLPKALIRIIDSIFPLIGQMFKTWAKKIQKEYPFFAKILNWVGDLFGKEGTLTKFFKSLASLAPVLIGLGIAIKVIMTLSAVLNPFTVIITGLVIAITYLKSVWDNSAKYFKESEKAMKGMNEQQEMLYRIQQKGTDMTQTLGRTFEIFKKKGFGAAVSDYFKEYILAWKQIKKVFSFKNMGKVLKKFGKWVWNQFKKLFSPIIYIFNSVSSAISSVMAPIKNLFGPILKTIGEVLSWIWDSIVKRIQETLKSIKAGLEGIFDWFSGFATFGMSWLFKDKEQQERYKKLSEATREAGGDLGKQEKWIEATAKERIAMKEKGEISTGDIKAANELLRLAGKAGKEAVNFEDVAEKIIESNKATKKATTYVKNQKSFMRLRGKKGRR